MGYLTSFTFKGVELNDGTHFSIPFADSAFDDRQSVEGTYAYRRDNLPVQTAINIKEGTLPLNITVIGATPALFEANLSTLKKIFNTMDPTFYPLNRMLPFEQNYRYITVAPREFNVNRLERKVTITLHTLEKAWKDQAESSANKTLFVSSNNDSLTVNYPGYVPIEPIIEITPIAAQGAGAAPLWSRTVEVYAARPQDVVGQPMIIAEKWNDTGGKAKADGTDISVTMPDGTQVPRLVLGPQNARDIWVKMPSWVWTAQWNLLPDSTGGGAGTVVGATDVSIQVESAIKFQYYSSAGPMKVRIDNEIISFTGIVYDFNQADAVLNTVSGKWRATLTGCTRGVDGSVAATHLGRTPVQRCGLLTIRYGYSAGYSQTFYNDYTGWPLLDYPNSDNLNWKQTATVDMSILGYGSSGQTMTWVKETSPNNIPRKGEFIYGSGDFQFYNNTSTMRFDAKYDPTSSGGVVQRFRINQPRHRNMNSVRVRGTMNCGAGTVKRTTTFGLKSVLQNLGNVNEVNALLSLISRTVSATTDAGTTFDTGTLAFGNSNLALAIELQRAPAATPTNYQSFLYVSNVDWTWANDFSRPVHSSLSSEIGSTTGVHSFYISFYNSSDPNSPPPMVLSGNFALNNKITIDCLTRTITGATLSDTALTYRNPIWMRLVNGNNVIVTTGVVGVGQTTFNVRFIPRY